MHWGRRLGGHFQPDSEMSMDQQVDQHRVFECRSGPLGVSGFSIIDTPRRLAFLLGWTQTKGIFTGPRRAPSTRRRSGRLRWGRRDSSARRWPRGARCSRAHSGRTAGRGHGDEVVRDCVEESRAVLDHVGHSIGPREQRTGGEKHEEAVARSTLERSPAAALDRPSRTDARCVRVPPLCEERRPRVRGEQHDD